MYFLEYFCNKNLKYDLINKFSYTNIKKIPKITQIVLNFGCKTTELKVLSASLLALELITNQKGTLTKTKYSNISLKIRKGNPTGCKVILKKKLITKFLSNQLIEILTKVKTLTNKKLTKTIKKNAFSYKIENTFYFSNLENHYYLFHNLPKLNITIVTNTYNSKEMQFFIKTFKIHFI